MEETGSTRLMNERAFNELYRICYKAIVGKSTRPVSDGEIDGVYKCHKRVIEVFKIIQPVLFKKQESSGEKEEWKYAYNAIVIYRR